MKPTKEEIKYLNEFLDMELVYRETYDEMQDHLLSALQQYPDNVDFETALHEIIDTQFGGAAGLRAIDRQYQKHGVIEMRKRYLNHILNMFRFPSVIYLAIVSLAGYALFNYLSFNKGWYWVVFWTAAILPGLVNSIRYIRMGYQYRTIKRSVSDDGFKLLKYVPGVLFTFFMLYHFVLLNEKPAEWIKIVDPTFATFILAAYFLHAVAFFKMYNEEFKVDLAK